MRIERSIPATVLQPSGEMITVTLPTDEQARLRALQDIVGGYLQVVPLRDKRYLVVDEEGKSKPHHRNDFATWLARESEAITEKDYIAGVAVLVSNSTLS